MDLPVDFKELLEEFARGRVEFILVGGYAVAFHGRPRATKDIDLLVNGTRANLERAAAALERFGAPANVVRAVEAMQPSDIVYMGQAPLRIDLLRAIDGVATEAVLARAVTAVLDGVEVRVISLDDLIANKRASGRQQDLMDAELLERVRGVRT